MSSMVHSRRSTPSDETSVSLDGSLMGASKVKVVERPSWGREVVLAVDGLWSGLQDGLRWPSVVRLMMDSVSIRDHALESVKLNFGVLILPYAAGRFLPDLAETLIGKVHPSAGIAASYFVMVVAAFMLLMGIVVSALLNAKLYADIANESYEAMVGRRRNAPGSVGRAIGEVLFSNVMMFVFNLQGVGAAALIGAIPLPGAAGVAMAVKLLNTAVLYGFWSFEYKWMNKGYDLRVRTVLAEARWAYLLGYGLPFACACLFLPFVVSMALFAVLYPAFIVMSNEGVPKPASKVAVAPATRRLPVFQPALVVTNKALLSTGALGKVSPFVGAMVSYVLQIMFGLLAIASLGVIIVGVGYVLFSPSPIALSIRHVLGA